MRGRGGWGPRGWGFHLGLSLWDLGEPGGLTSVSPSVAQGLAHGEGAVSLGDIKESFKIVVK